MCWLWERWRTFDVSWEWEKSQSRRPSIVLDFHTPLLILFSIPLMRDWICNFLHFLSATNYSSLYFLFSHSTHIRNMWLAFAIILKSIWHDDKILSEKKSIKRYWIPIVMFHFYRREYYQGMIKKTLSMQQFFNFLYHIIKFFLFFIARVPFHHHLSPKKSRARTK